MDNKRLDVKVGLFVFIGLFLMAVLLVLFSKGTSVFHGTYNLRLHATNVGGLKLRASVLLAGVIVGDVSDIQLAQDGKSVTILLKIYNGVIIYGDAHFVIEQAGFLGDNFVAILPTDNKAAALVNNDSVDCEPPFDLLAVARSATGFINRVDDTVRKIEDSVSQLQKTVLNQETMTNLTITIANLRAASDQAVIAVNDIDSLVATNRDQVNFAISNVVYFSQDLTQLANNANNILATNGVALSESMSNIQVTTETLRQIGDDVKSGKGMAGTILENPEAATNLQATISNLAVATSNLNQLGLWGFLWHHQGEPARTSTNSSPSKYSTPRGSQKP
jgi:phospholipid/cholesterol/gamma-HCH transport system substrate-binding protein